MVISDTILGRNVANPKSIDVSGLAGREKTGTLDVSIVQPSVQSTLNVDPQAFIDSSKDAGDLGGVAPDVDLAQARVKPVADKAAIESKANAEAAAKGGVVGTAAVEAVSIFTNMQTLKAEDRIFMEKIQRGHETLEFNQRLARNASNISALNASLNAIDSLNKQGGNVLAGGQEQLFLRSPNSGRLV